MTNAAPSTSVLANASTDSEAVTTAARVVLELLTGHWTTTLAKWLNEDLAAVVHRPAAGSAVGSTSTVDVVAGFGQLLRILAAEASATA